MTQISLLASIAESASAHPKTTLYVAGAVAMLTILAGVAVVKPGALTAAVDRLAAENTTDRRLLLGATIVMWSAGWPVTLLVIVGWLAWRR